MKKLILTLSLAVLVISANYAYAASSIGSPLSRDHSGKYGRQNNIYRNDNQ